jgi:uncharacterized membrane protein
MRHAEPKRSFAKSVTWRLCATLTTVILVWVWFHDVKAAFAVGAVEIIVKMVVYYIHERAWNKVGWGLYKTE